jgi:hypothetical protein
MYWHCRERHTDQGQAICLAFFAARQASGPFRNTIMTQTHSRSRQQAEVAFGKTQTEFFARGQAMDALDSIALARDEKTARLREARKAKELADRLSGTTLVIGKRKTRA